MAKEYSFKAPVIVEDNTGSYKPVERNGHMVVDSSVVGGLQPGAVVLYDYVSGMYSKIDYSTATPDYIQKVSNYSNQYLSMRNAPKASNIFSDASNTKEINSFADVIGAMPNPFKAIANPINQTAVEAYKTDGILGVFNNMGKEIGDTANNVFDLIKNTTINPLRSNNNNLVKGKALLNNTLINFSETIDMFTMANSVKGFAKGVKDEGLKEGIKNIGKGFGVGDDGREQYNVNTGNTAVDIALEIAADPTTWITLGGVAIGKTLGKKTVSDMLVKSATDVGETVVRKDADKLASKIIRYWKNSDEALGEAVGRVQLNKYAQGLNQSIETVAKQGDIFDAKSLQKIFTAQSPDVAVSGALKKEVQYLQALKNNADILQKSKTYKLLEGYKSVLRGSDAVQNAAAVAAMNTSATVMGYVPIAGIKGLLGNAAVLEKVQTIFNGINKEVVNAKFDITDVTAKADFVNDKLLTVRSALSSEADGYLAAGVARTSKKDLEDLVTNVNKILTNVDTVDNTLIKANELVSLKTGGDYKTVQELLARISEVKDRTHIDIRPLINDMSNRFSVIQHKVEKNAIATMRHVVKELPEMYEAAVVSGEVTEKLTVLRQLTRELSYKVGDASPLLDSLGVLGTMVDDILNMANLKDLSKFEDHFDILYKGVDELETMLDALGTLDDVTEEWVAPTSVKVKSTARNLAQSLADVTKVYRDFHGLDDTKTFLSVPKRNESGVTDNISAIKTKHADSIMDVGINLRHVSELLEDGEKTNTYNLDYTSKIVGEVSKEWSKGELTKESLIHMDSLLDTLGYQLTNNPKASVYVEEIREIVNMLENEITYEEFFIDKSVLDSGPLYMPRVPLRVTMNMLLQVEALQGLFANIYRSEGVGQLVDLAIYGHTGDAIVDAAKNLAYKAHDNYITSKLLSYVNTLSNDIERKALMDVLASKQQIDVITSIPDPVTFTDRIIEDMRNYIDRTTNNQAPMLREMGKGIDTLEKARNIYQLAYKDDALKDFSGLITKDGAYKDMIYSMAPANNSVFYEVTVLDPNTGRSLTVINKDALNIVPTEKVSRKIYGMSSVQLKEHKAEVQHRKFTKGAEVIEAADMDAVGIILNNFLRGIKEEARSDKQVVRMIGFNNANETNATDRMFNNLLRVTNTAQSIGSTVGLRGVGTMFTEDIAQLYRRKQGSWVASNQYVEKLVKLFTGIGTYIEATHNAALNRGLLEYKPSMIVDIDNKLIDNINEIADTLSNYLDSPKSIDKTLADTLSMFQRQELVGILGNLQDTAKDIGETLGVIKNSNTDLSDTLIIQKGLSKHLKTPNIMPYIDELGFSIKTFNNPAITNTWFDLSSEASYSMNFIPTVYANARIIQNIHDKIRITKDLLAVKEPLRTLAINMRKKIIETPDSKFASLHTVVAHLKPIENLSVTELYAVSKWMYSRLRGLLPKETMWYTIYKAAELDGTSGSMLLDVLDEPEVYVYSTAPRFVQGISPIKSKHLQENAVLLEETTTLEFIKKQTKNASSIKELLRSRAHLLESANITKSWKWNKIELVDTYLDFYESMNRVYEGAMSRIPVDTMQGDALMKDRVHFSKYLEATFSLPKEIFKKTHNDARVLAEMNLKGTDLVKYIYKYASGIQIIDLSAEVFKADGMEQAWLQFMESIKTGKEYGLESMVDDKKNLMYLWIDAEALGDLGLGMLHTEAKTFKVKSLATVGTIEYMRLAKEMDKYTDNAFSMSTHSGLSIYQYNELLSTLPKQVADTMLTSDYLDTYGLLSGTLNASLLGDYAFGAYNIVSNLSPDPYTNIASGFNTVFNKTETIDNYTVMLDRAENKLNYFIEHGFTHEDILASGLIPIKLENGRVLRTSIKTTRDFNKALNSNVLMLDYASYKKASEILNDNAINSKLYKALNKYWLVPDKVGKLTSIGQSVRNIPESISKVWVQAGGDPAVFYTIPESFKILQKYDRTSALLAKETTGFVNKESIDRFYVKYADSTDILPKGDYERFKQFFNSSDSAPTAQQAKERADILGTLRRAAAGSEKINDSMLQFVMAESVALKFNKRSIDRAIEEAYGNMLSKDDILILKRVKAFVPEWYKTPSKLERTLESFYNNPFLKLGSWVETLIRFHAFRYFSDDGIRTTSESLELISKGQNNRSTETKAQKLVETVFPFSSFALHNLIFWAETATRKNSIIGLMEDIYSGYQDDQFQDIEQLSRNYSLQYAFSVNNIILDDETGLTFKWNGSMFSALNFLSDPLGTFAEMTQGTLDSVLRLIGVLNHNIPFYAEDSEEYAEAVEEAKKDYVTQMIPLFNVLHTRYESAWKNYELSDSLLTMLFPSVFGVTKLDSAGTTYESRPVGTDWYSQTQAYRDTHRYVFGVSYVPSWMKKDPSKYMDTLGRLLNAGYSRDEALKTMENGWYVSYKDQQFHNWKTQQEEYAQRQAEYAQRKPYTYNKKAYTGRRSYGRRSYAKRSYAKKSYSKARTFKKYYYARGNTPNNKPYAVNLRKSNASMYPAAYRNMKYFGQRNLYKDLYAKYGASRMMMRMFAGAAPSASKLLRDEIKQRVKKQYRRF